jgi:hypothetical protein
VNMMVTRQGGHIYLGPEAGPGVHGLSASARAGRIDRFGQPSPQAVDRYAPGGFITGDAYAPLWPVPELDSGIGPSIGGTWSNLYHPGWHNASTEGGVGVGIFNNASMMTGYDWRMPFSY